MKTRPDRWLPDALRLSYTRRVAAPDGTEMVVRAIRKQDVNVADELTWFLPWPIYIAGQAIRELRTRHKYEGLWIVKVGHRRGFQKERWLGEFPKAGALDLVDARADEIIRGA